MSTTTLAVIGGSRAYDLLKSHCFGPAGKTQKVKTPFGPSAPVRLFKGDGFSFWFLSRHGEKGYQVSAPYVNYRANVWALKKLGVERIVSWSQPGAINPDIKPGEYALPHDIIDMTKNRPGNFFEGTGLGFIRMSEPFCPEVRSALAHALEGPAGGNFLKKVPPTPPSKTFSNPFPPSKRKGKDLTEVLGGSLREPFFKKVPLNRSSWHGRGVYVCTEGPRLETPAEIKMFAQWGGDLVGMTLAPEAFLARQLEMCYAAICLSSNFAEGVVQRKFKEGELFEGMLSATEREAVEESVARLPLIVGAALQNLAGLPRACKCGVAMERYRKQGRVKDLLKAAKIGVIGPR